MPVQAMKRRLFQNGRRSAPHFSCLSLPQTIFRSVNGMPFPVA